ncbi:MAG: WXG100 family type VII secretion target [Bacilli bacterium]|nr:WXG100 family type VII secretion target [Bacilli bacterium]
MTFIGDNNIDVETDSVGQVATEINNIYAEVDSLFTQIRNEAATLKGSWISSGADTYFAAFETVDQMFTDFGSTHANFISSIANICSAYDEEEAALRAAAESLGSGSTASAAPSSGGTGVGTNFNYIS